MRRISLTLLTLFTFLSFKSFGQNQDSSRTEQETRAMLCQKWKTTFIEVDGKQAPVPEAQADLLFVTNDGSYTLHSERFKEMQGKWTYDHKTRALFLGEEKGNSKILKLTPEELVIKGEWMMNGEGQGIFVHITFKKVQ